MVWQVLLKRFFTFYDTSDADITNQQQKLIPEAYLKAYQTSKMKHFAKIVKDF